MKKYCGKQIHPKNKSKSVPECESNKDSFATIKKVQLGGTGRWDSIKIIFGNHVYSLHTILNIKFFANRAFDVLKIPAYRFHLYGRYRILSTDAYNFW